MENNNKKKNNAFISEEEKTLNWEDIQNSFKKTFGSEIYNSWLQKISLVKEYNDFLILGFIIYYELALLCMYYILLLFTIYYYVLCIIIYYVV